MSAIRLARGFTRRDRILKFDGCYHGHADALLACAGSGLATLGIPSLAGRPVGASPPTRSSCPTTTSMRPPPRSSSYGEGLAAIIVEPVAGNMGVVPPAEGFLEALRTLCDASGALLIFDEVITGFRVARGGAQERYGVLPDLTMLGKIVGGGLPLAAFGGRADADGAARPGRRRLPGGHAVGQPARDRGRASRCCGGCATRRSTRSSSAAAPGSRRGSRGRRGRPRPAGRRDADPVHDRAGRSRDFEDAPRATRSATRRSSVTCSQRGIYVAPSQFEAMFVSLAHGDAGDRPDGRGRCRVPWPLSSGRRSPPRPGGRARSGPSRASPRGRA